MLVSTVQGSKLTICIHISGSDHKEPACNAGSRVWSLGWEDPLEKGMATHSSILAWRIPWTEETGGLQFMRVTKSWTQQNDSNLYIHPPLLDLPHTTPISHLPGHHRAPSWAPCAVQQAPIRYLFHTRRCICINATPPMPPTLSFHLCPPVPSLCLHLYSCPVNRFISTIFLDST